MLLLLLLPVPLLLLPPLLLPPLLPPRLPAAPSAEAAGEEEEPDMDDDAGLQERWALFNLCSKYRKLANPFPADEDFYCLWP